MDDVFAKGETNGRFTCALTLRTQGDGSVVLCRVIIYRGGKGYVYFCKKIICFIPFIDILIIPFMWFRLYYTKPVPRKKFFECMLKNFIVLIIIAIPRIVISRIFGPGTIDNITNYIAIILLMFFISFFMVKNEEQLQTKY